MVIQNFELDSELEKDSDIEKEQNKFNAVHVDQTILATEKEKILGNLYVVKLHLFKVN